MTEVTVRRQTRPEVKWLANELAATAGEIARVDKEIAGLMARKGRLQAIHAALSNVAGQLAQPLLPKVVPVVHAHDERYGGRGAFKRWLSDKLQEAYPLALDTAQLTDMASVQFGLELGTPEQRNRFRKNCLGRALRKLLDTGLVERLHDYRGVPDMAGVWRWKAAEPSLDALRRRAKALGAQEKL